MLDAAVLGALAFMVGATSLAGCGGSSGVSVPDAPRADTGAGDGAGADAAAVDGAGADATGADATGADGPSGETSIPSLPAHILDLTNWKETLPTGSPGSPTEIKQPELATYVNDPYFKLNPARDGVQFRAHTSGVTTSGSGYPRSELREMTNGGSTLASWSTSSGTHTMFIDQAITAVPATKKHVVAGQIHDSADDVIVIRLELPKLFIDINGTDGPTLDPAYTLGKRFTVKFVASGGQIAIYYNGGTTAAHTLTTSTSGCYFKAGAYTQSNCSTESSCGTSNYGEVHIHDLWLQHIP